MAKTRAYKKSITREILSSKARFISILVIILLGTAFYSGIKSSGPDINKAINKLYTSYNLMDSKIVLSLGLTNKDLDLLKDNDKILDFYGTHTIDANLTNINSVVRFMEYDKYNDINKFIVVEGRLPKNSGEIALDEEALKINKSLKVGDTYTIDSDKDTMKSFKKNKYKIVGIVKSPMYIEEGSRGTTSVGKGSIDYFAVLNKNDISSDVYTEIYVRFKNVQNLDAYSKEYKDKMEENNKYIESLYSNRGLERSKEIKAEAQIELNKAYTEIEDNENKLLNAEKETKDGKAKIQDAKTQYEKGLKEYEKKIEEGKSKLNEGKVKLDKTKQEFLNLGIDPGKDISDLEINLPNSEILLAGINEYQKGKLQYEEQLNIISSGKAQLQEAQRQLDNSKLEITKGEKELKEGKLQGKKELEEVKKQISTSEQDLIKGENELNKNKEKLIDAKDEIKKEQEKIDNIKEGKYYLFDRNDNAGYSGLNDAINGLDSIASVFPVFFFLVAILICLTTMTRMEVLLVY